MFIIYVQITNASKLINCVMDTISDLVSSTLHFNEPLVINVNKAQTTIQKFENGYKNQKIEINSSKSTNILIDNVLNLIRASKLNSEEPFIIQVFAVFSILI